MIADVDTVDVESGLDRLLLGSPALPAPKPGVKRDVDLVARLVKPQADRVIAAEPYARFGAARPGTDDLPLAIAQRQRLLLIPVGDFRTVRRDGATERAGIDRTRRPVAELHLRQRTIFRIAPLDAGERAFDGITVKRIALRVTAEITLRVVAQLHRIEQCALRVFDDDVVQIARFVAILIG